MKRLFRWTIVLVASIAVLAAGGYIAARYLLYKEALDNATSGLAYIRTVIFAYAEDSRATQRTPIFPQKIEDLAKENYLVQDDIRDCTDGMDVVYSPPPEKAPDNFLLLKGTGRNFILYCPLRGKITQTKPN